MKRTVSLILALILCLGALPLGALAMDMSPALWEMYLYRKGAEMQFEMEYGFDSSFDFVELYMLGDKAKDGDLKGPLGLMDIGGEIYHLLGIQTIDTNNKQAFHKDEKTGLWVARGALYLGDQAPPAPGTTVGIVVETGEYNGLMRKSEIIHMKTPADGKKTVYTAETPKTVEVSFKPNGGKGKMEKLIAQNGVQTVLPKNAFTRSKYEFIAWNTKKNGSGKTCKDGAKVTLDRDTVLYAQWAKISLKMAKVSTVKPGKKLTLKATLKLDGKAVKGKEVTFKFNGKSYTAKTNKKGVAKVTVGAGVTGKLKSGKKITAKVSYGGVTVSKKVKVK